MSQTRPTQCLLLAFAWQLLLLAVVHLVAINGSPLPSLARVPPGNAGAALILDGLDGEWTAAGGLLAVDPSASSITLRRATIRGLELLHPVPQAPLALATSGYSGATVLEDLLLIAPSCDELDALANLACDAQPATWITSDGRSVTVNSFTPPPNLSSAGSPTTSLYNVTLTCDRTTDPAAPRRTAACATLTVASEQQLLAALTLPYNTTTTAFWPLPSPPPPPVLRLHVTILANLSLTPANWAAAPPALTRPNTTLSGDCAPGRTTALDLNGRLSLLAVRGGGALRLRCLELSNLATDAAGNMPRGLAAGAMWAITVDATAGSRMVVEDSTLILTREEYLWQSYFIAAYLASPYNASATVTALQAAVTPTGLLWKYSVTPRTLWLNVMLGFTPSVFPVTVPNSSIRTYLGPTTYIGEVQVLGNCSQLLAAVRAADPKRTLYALRANTSLADCWPAGGVTVAAPGFSLLGMPDDSVTLDLGGLHDAMILAPDATVSLRYLTLAGLGSHVEHDDQVELADSSVEGLGQTTALLWAFRFPRSNAALNLLHTTLVLPAVELQQYGRLAVPDPAVPALAYFAPLGSYFKGSALTGSNTSATASALAPAASSAPRPLPAAAANVTELLSFRSLILPGIKASDTNLTCWPGLYAGWSEQLYDTAGRGDGGGGAGGGGGGGWEAWRVGVLAGGLVFVLLAAGVASALLYRSIAKARGLQGKRGAKEVLGAEVGGDQAGGVQPEAASAAVVASVRRESEPRRPAFYDSFDDPVSEPGFFKTGVNPNAQELQIILDRANTEANTEYETLDLKEGDPKARQTMMDEMMLQAARSARATLHPLAAANSASGGGGNAPVGAPWEAMQGGMNQLIADFQVKVQAARPSEGPSGARERKELGRGAFGVVILGEWCGQPAAVKLLLLQLEESQTRRERVAREVALTLTLRHPHIVPTYDFQINPIRADNTGARASPEESVMGRAAESSNSSVVAMQACFTMQYCEGGTLAAALRGGMFTAPPGQPTPSGAAGAGNAGAAGAAGSTPPARVSPAPDVGVENAPTTARAMSWSDVAAAQNLPLALLAACDVLRGLEYLHTCSVVHGDLTEGNILLKAVRPVLPTLPPGRTAGGDAPLAHGSSSDATVPSAWLAAGSASPFVADSCSTSSATPAADDCQQQPALEPAPALVVVPAPLASAPGDAAEALGCFSTNSACAAGASGSTAGLTVSMGSANAFPRSFGAMMGATAVLSGQTVKSEVQAGASGAAEAAKRLLRYSFKLADFGLAVQMRGPDQTHVSNMAQGTPCFIAPEVFTTGRMSTAADCYSFGVLLWLLLHGVALAVIRPLVRGHAFVPIASQLLRHMSPALPSGAHDILRACLQLQPDARPTASELRKRVEELLREIAGPELSWMLLTAQRVEVNTAS